MVNFYSKIGQTSSIFNSRRQNYHWPSLLLDSLTCSKTVSIKQIWSKAKLLHCLGILSSGWLDEESVSFYSKGWRNSEVLSLILENHSHLIQIPTFFIWMSLPFDKLWSSSLPHSIIHIFYQIFESMSCWIC